MKRFLLFAGHDYYPAGGWDDFVGSFDTIEEARADGQARDVQRKQWFHIVDLQTGKIVKD